jgi:beta-1,4-mannosyl-glycoprotein beta-1,4-N-acetylglucosaminyltransferase
VLKKPDRKVYDCFTYYNEDKLLGVRLNTLYDYVDYFVISEAPRSHSGVPRPL